MIRRAILAFLALLITVPALAQAPTPEFRSRAEMLVGVLREGRDETGFFAPSFTSHVPPAEIRAVAQRLKESNGDVVGLHAVQAAGRQSGVVQIAYQKSIVRFEMTVEPVLPHQVIGLLVVGVDPRDDSTGKLIAEFRALPGSSGLLVMPLGRAGAGPVLAHNAQAPLAIGSGFKLWILAELARATAAGERRWGDVVPLGPPSLPSGITQNWPHNTPMTLESLAVLAMSISDNTATDTLLSVLGRERVGAMIGATGHSAPARTLPVLSTTEAFALKMTANSDLRARWESGSLGERLNILRREQARLARANVVAAELGAGPRHIENIEWFASAGDMIRTLDWLRTNGGPTALDILKVNPGIPAGDAARFDYIGFKGGSEAGVISLHFLVRAKSGQWFAASGTWNNPAAPVDNERFSSLMGRVLALLK